MASAQISKIKNEGETKMFILSQDKKTLGEYLHIAVSKNYGGRKNEKYFLVGSSRLLLGQPVLGKYPTEEAAIRELGNICAALDNNESTYAVK